MTLTDYQPDLSFTQPIERTILPGLDVITVTAGDTHEHHITLQPLPGEELSATFHRLQAFLQERDAAIVKFDSFGSLAAFEETTVFLSDMFCTGKLPLRWIQSSQDGENRFSGAQVLALSGAKVRTIYLHNCPVASVFEDDRAKQLFISGITPRNLSASPMVQTMQTYEMLCTVLELAGMDFSNLVRTWFFLDDILEWYPTFNAIRNRLCAARESLDGIVPASTGISGKNPAGAALAMSAWAMQPCGGATQIREAPSPLQCSAKNYGSHFSRVVEIATPEFRRVIVSGTASIDCKGRSVFERDVRGQIAQTMEVVEAILVSRGLKFCDVSRAIAYFKRPQDLTLFDQWCRHEDLNFPVLTVQADVCRKELLFELELDAIAPAHREGKTNSDEYSI